MDLNGSVIGPTAPEKSVALFQIPIPLSFLIVSLYFSLPLAQSDLLPVSTDVAGILLFEKLQGQPSSGMLRRLVCEYSDMQAVGPGSA